jgi:hypothetical protein
MTAGFKRAGATLAALTLIGLTVSAASAAKPIVPVTNCYNLVQDAIGELQGDLNCSTFGPTIVDLENATLRLNGFTITGIAVPTGGATAGVINCRKKCTIEGPGTIVGGEAGIVMGGGKIVRVENVEIRDSLNVGANIVGESRARFTNVKIEDSDGCAYIGETLILKDSEIVDNQCGIYSTGKLRVVDSDIINNTGSPDYQFGVFSGKPKISGSTLTGNLPDVKSNEKPGFHDSTCELSDANGAPGANWGICSLDP